MRSLSRHAVTLLALIVAAALVTACAPERAADVEFIPEGGSYTLSAAEQRAEKATLGELADDPADAAPEKRRAALVALRRAGDEGGRVADILTKEFPPSESGVPTLVEGARVDDKDTWLVVEAIKGSDGKLSARRLWILDRADGSVIGSRTFR